jgi:RimJ/RimL family protein N-acetyltransferase
MPTKTFDLLETARLLLRPFTKADVPAMTPVYGNPLVMKHLLHDGVDAPSARDMIKRFIDCWQCNGFGIFVVVLKENGRPIGHCGLNYLEGGCDIELLYLIDQPFWGRGLATEAAAAVLGYAFNAKKFPRIVAVAMPENLESRKVMEKLGMRLVRSGYYYGRELVYYAISSSEFRNGGH